MKKKNLMYGIIIALIAVSLIAGVILTQTNGNPIIINPNPDNGNEVENEPKLTCYGFIDEMLKADGFEYLQDAKWGRGVNNSFIFDVEAQEFQMANELNANMIPSDWYVNDFNKYISQAYNYVDNKIWNTPAINAGYSKDAVGATVPFDPNDVTGYYYEFPHWMAYYNEQAAQYGCSLTDLTTEKLLGEYKATKSTAGMSDVVSVFDRKSTDGVLRYFADVHQEGKVEDNPRYVELNSVEEYMALDNAENFETQYYVNILYHNPENYTFFPDLSGVQSSVIKEFTKDVVFEQTTWIKDEPTNPTLGIYFIYIDNPNGNFKSLYVTPSTETSGKINYSLSKFDTMKTPFEGSILLVNKTQVDEGVVWELTATRLMETLKWYLRLMHDNSPRFEYSEDFVTNYTRPFNPDWQNRMGLTALFDAKYGFTNKNIEYTWNK